MRKLSLLLILSILLYAGCSNHAQLAPADVQPRLVRISPDGLATLSALGRTHLLQLSGTPYQMGYNHGLLLAPQIKSVLTEYVFWIVQKNKLDYAALIELQQSFDFSPFEQELQGMLDGLRAGLPADQRLITPPGGAERQFELEDIKLANSMGDWLMDALACSSLCVWGADRPDGAPLLARNFDWYANPNNSIMDNQAIIVRRGENAPGWVNVSFAGELGCVSGLNEHGVAAMIHVAFGADKSVDSSGIVPGTLALRRALEAAGPRSGPADADALLDSLPGLGAYTFIMVFGGAGRTDDQTAGVFEYDGNRAGSDGRSTWRKPSDNPSLPHSALRDQRIERSDELINVNHYLKRKTWVPVWFSSGRYVHIKQGLERDSADGLLDADEAAQIIAGTGLAPSWILGPWCTLHTVVVQPRQGLLRVYLAADGRPGYEQQPLELSLAELLAKTPK